jgi:hypothetical protein
MGTEGHRGSRGLFKKKEGRREYIRLQRGERVIEGTESRRRDRGLQSKQRA